MMVVVKTDTNIYLNVEGFKVSEGHSKKVNGHDICIEKPGLYIKLTSCNRYVPVIYCDVGKAREMLCDIGREIIRYRSRGLVLAINDGRITSF